MYEFLDKIDFSSDVISLPEKCWHKNSGTETHETSIKSYP
jgi:hypothetical protein